MEAMWFVARCAVNSAVNYTRAHFINGDGKRFSQATLSAHFVIVDIKNQEIRKNFCFRQNESKQVEQVAKQWMCVVTCRILLFDRFYVEHLKRYADTKLWTTRIAHNDGCSHCAKDSQIFRRMTSKFISSFQLAPYLLIFTRNAKTFYSNLTMNRLREAIVKCEMDRRKKKNNKRLYTLDQRMKQWMPSTNATRRDESVIIILSKILYNFIIVLFLTQR